MSERKFITYPQEFKEDAVRQYLQGGSWYTANAYGMQSYIDTTGNTELQVKVNAPSDFVVTSYRCIVTDSKGTSVTSDTVKLTVS